MRDPANPTNTATTRRLSTGHRRHPPIVSRGSEASAAAFAAGESAGTGDGLVDRSCRLALSFGALEAHHAANLAHRKHGGGAGQAANEQAETVAIHLLAVDTIEWRPVDGLGGTGWRHGATHAPPPAPSPWPPRVSGGVG